MDIRALKYFVKVADEKSFLRASEKLFTTQPNVSRTIKQLEEELNVQLFIRHGKESHYPRQAFHCLNELKLSLS